MKKILLLLVFSFSLNAVDDEQNIINMMDSCYINNNYNCVKAGNILMDVLDKNTLSKEGEKIYFEAAIYAFKKACDNGFGVGCGWLGIIYSGDKFGKTNIHKESDMDLMIGYYARACLFEEATGCAMLGAKYKEYNKILAIKFFKKSCELGYKEGCTELSKVLK